MKYPRTRAALAAFDARCASLPPDTLSDAKAEVLDIAVGRAYGEDTGYDVDVCEKAVRVSQWLLNRIDGKSNAWVKIPKRFTPGTVLMLMCSPGYFMPEGGMLDTDKISLPFSFETGSGPLEVVSVARTGPDRAWVTYRWNGKIISRHEFLDAFRSYRKVK